ncbi:MAG: hypothetical protein Q9208_008766 [Pyrenodesmia sp. 3 TL-2023]
MAPEVKEEREGSEDAVTLDSHNPTITPETGNSHQEKTHPIVASALPAHRAGLGLPATSFQKDGSVAAKCSAKNREKIAKYTKAQDDFLEWYQKAEAGSMRVGLNIITQAVNHTLSTTPNPILQIMAKAYRPLSTTQSTRGRKSKKASPETTKTNTHADRRKTWIALERCPIYAELNQLQRNTVLLNIVVLWNVRLHDKLVILDPGNKGVSAYLGQDSELKKKGFEDSAEGHSAWKQKLLEQGGKRREWVKFCSAQQDDDSASEWEPQTDTESNYSFDAADHKDLLQREGEILGYDKWTHKLEGKMEKAGIKRSFTDADKDLDWDSALTKRVKIDERFRSLSVPFHSQSVECYYAQDHGPKWSPAVEGWMFLGGETPKDVPLSVSKQWRRYGTT